MTKAHTPTENSKKQSDNTKSHQNFDYTTIAELSYPSQLFDIHDQRFLRFIVFHDDGPVQSLHPRLLVNALMHLMEFQKPDGRDHAGYVAKHTRTEPGNDKIEVNCLRIF